MLIHRVRTGSRFPLVVRRGTGLEKHAVGMLLNGPIPATPLTRGERHKEAVTLNDRASSCVEPLNYDVIIEEKARSA